MPKTMDSGDCPGRPVFFDRQSLTADDLNAVISYFRSRMHRHNRHLLGSGVTCGLAVGPVAGAAWQVRVSAGHAILPSGEEVEVPADAQPFDICEAARACLGIPGACPAPFDLDDPANQPGDAAGPSPLATVGRVDFTTLPAEWSGPDALDLGPASIRVRGDSNTVATRARSLASMSGLDLARQAEITLARPADRVILRLLRGAGQPIIVARGVTGAELDRLVMTGPSGSPETLTVEGPGIAWIEIVSAAAETVLLGLEIPAESRGHVWLALCADETPTRFQPGLPEACRPVGENLFPSRICEGYRLHVLCAPPVDVRPDCETLAAILCDPAHVPCPQAGGDCVVIATLAIGDDGILSIDEFSDRRRVLPQWLLADHAACQCAAPLPTPAPSSTPSPPPPSSVPPSIPPTVFSIPTVLTGQPTHLTFPITFPTFFPTLFTLPTLVPTLIPTIRPTRIRPTRIRVTRGPGGPVILDDEVMNRLADVDVGTLLGIGRVRSGALQAAGINTLADFNTRGSEELARIMGISEVRVAGMRDEVLAIARGRIR